MISHNHRRDTLRRTILFMIGVRPELTADVLLPLFDQLNIKLVWCAERRAVTCKEGTR